MLMFKSSTWATLVVLAAVAASSAGQDRAVPSVEEQLRESRAEHAAFLRAYREISTGYEEATAEDRALLDSYTAAAREHEAAERAWRDLVRRSVPMYHIEAVQVARMDYNRKISLAARAESNDDPDSARQLREAARTEYDEAVKAAVEGTPFAGHLEAEDAARRRVESAWADRFATRRALAKRKN